MVEADLASQEGLSEIVEGHDAIIHLAAESHNDNSLRNPKPFIDSNVMGTFNLLEAVRQFGIRFHHVSTDEVFGDLPLGSPTKFSESTPYQPSSPYSASKAASDHLVRAWVRSFGIAATISNCSNNYGKYQHIEKFVPRQITNLISGLRPKIYGSGLNVRDWIHVDDHIDALKLILNNGKIGETYLIGTDGEMSNIEVLRVLLAATGHEPDYFDATPDRSGHDLRYAIDSHKLRSDLGWNPTKRDFSVELNKLVEWYTKNTSWWIDAKKAVEESYEKEGR
jgi:dTDP-glucose 4,6-dehydratase